MLLTSSTYSIAQRARPIINHIPAETQSLDLEKLAQTVTRKAQTPSAKSQAIFEWIAGNIKYDLDLRYDKNLQQDYFRSKELLIEKALERKKTVCAGYAYLFQALCAEVGIEATVIDGFTKKAIPSKTLRKKVHHTWNAVKLNGKWELLDITWATSNGTKQVPDLFWYRTPPQEFILTHYPENVSWTLLERPISFRTFEGVAVP